MSSQPDILCQDVIFHQVTGIADCVRKKKTPDITDKPVKLGRYIAMTISQSRKEHVPNNKASDLWPNVPEHDKEISQGQDFNTYKLIQDKHLRNLCMTDLIDENYGTCQIRDSRQRQKK